VILLLIHRSQDREQNPLSFISLTCPPRGLETEPESGWRVWNREEERWGDVPSSQSRAVWNERMRYKYEVISAVAVLRVSKRSSPEDGL